MNGAGLIGALLAIDPDGLGGVWVRARSGDRQRTIQNALTEHFSTVRRVSPEVDDDVLFGGVDLLGSLGRNQIVRHRGILNEQACVVIAGGERTKNEFAARLSVPLDKGNSNGVILIDEGTEDDPLPPSALLDRLAFFVTEDATTEPFDIKDALARWGSVEIPAAMIEEVTHTATVCGIASLRAPLFAVRTMRALAALDGRAVANPNDAKQAMQLVYGHRTTETALEETNQDTQPEPGPDQEPKEGKSDADMPTELVLDAIATALPDGVLAAIAARAPRSRGSGQGRARASKLRGRPIPSRPGQPGGKNKIDLLATLHAAAPWQRLRNAKAGQIALRTEDVRIRQFKNRTERLLIFVVDASGSAAMARLAEAKGAAEHLLAEAYRSRDNVALIAFRGDGADLLLPPTRSLVRTKRALAQLPGGGSTPLAQGLESAYLLAEQSEKRGLTPQLIVMTDGRGNRTLSGEMNRAEAREDQVRIARIIAAKHDTLLVDCGRREGPEIAELGNALCARTIRLPAPGDSRAIHNAL